MQQYRLYVFVFIFFAFAGCKKAEPVATQHFTELNIPMLFSDTPPMDLYLNGRLADSTFNIGASFNNIIIPRGARVEIALKKAHTEEVLQDTSIIASEAVASLMFAYNETLGFNKFVSGSDFIRPASDSTAFMIFNNYEHFGNGLIDVVFYEDKNGDWMGTSEEEIGVLRNIPFGKLSEKISFPKSRDLDIFMLVLDPATNSNADYETVNQAYGLGKNYFSYVMRDIFPPATYGPPFGIINVIRVDAFPFDMQVDDGSGNPVNKTFNLYTAGYFFKY
ncbi:hypothetical protein [Niabella beijingensis]|uniref:hypothetical protein n=1 Tax=Niabella beijingensis TaxID=2872700 RepID=UPI001CBA8FBF|nr:hypothetical protein [Niabella beijingensis]MBZ4192288.1 hypothetical protein [Niabella beijingensis]